MIKIANITEPIIGKDGKTHKIEVDSDRVKRLANEIQKFIMKKGYDADITVDIMLKK